ncbi:glycosyl hydrolase [Methylacidiphilum kamchatkense Kam1]|uniref:Glycosyl hydrolase n=1 Tax=Methylacidiphilum kamchatkense Kam1 TaxID=1202785 RepID=A0ABR4ZZ33_9BACT|nr:LysM domain-containing protein [Methylacidiphilum kamchatkense]KIE59373.1 glycosyl hydrolase [Methylacidiphilum kamchatkense Kam1]
MEEKKSKASKPSFGLKVIAVLILVLGIHLLVIGSVAVYYLLHSKGRVLSQHPGGSQNLNFQPPSQQKMQSENPESAPQNLQVPQQPQVRPPTREISVHIVKEGESLLSIARHYKVSVYELKKYNPSLGDTLVPGQKIRIPMAEEEMAEESMLLKEADGKRIYAVRQGDSLWKIARKFHLSVKDIVDANAIKDPTKLKIGQELVIPNPKEKEKDSSSPSSGSSSLQNAPPPPQ